MFPKIYGPFSERGDSIDAFNREVCNYTTIENFQGVVIPRLRGYYECVGILEAPCP